MKKFKRGAILLVLLSFIAVAVAVYGTIGDTALGEKVAQAAINSQAYFDSEVRTFRSRQSSVQNVMLTDIRDLSRGKTEQEAHFEVSFEYQLPDRLRIVWDTYNLFPDEPGKRYLSSECPGV